MRKLVPIFKDTEEDWFKWFDLVDGEGSSCDDEVVLCSAYEFFIRSILFESFLTDWAPGSRQ
jgi:hypothetical protein